MRLLQALEYLSREVAETEDRDALRRMASAVEREAQGLGLVREDLEMLREQVVRVYHEGDLSR